MNAIQIQIMPNLAPYRVEPPNAQAKLRGLRKFPAETVSFSLWLGGELIYNSIK